MAGRLYAVQESFVVMVEASLRSATSPKADPLIGPFAPGSSLKLRR